LLCYDTENTRLIARWIEEAAIPLHEERKLHLRLIENHLQDLATHRRVIEQLTFETEVLRGHMETLEDRLDTFNLVLSGEAQGHRRQVRRHWVGHILSIGALTGAVLWGATR
jgi:hypothetical protein